ncbi:MAG: divalent-cation tolerance protein CutA [Fibrobacteria bacterium]|jgi:periplasmic divalent cation tolerance protein
MTATVAYITSASREQSLRIGKALLEARLVACFNLLDGMESMYWWQGQIESAQECVLIAKTVSGRKAEILAMVKALHTYTVPCVVFWPLRGGNPDYLAWIKKETGHG